MSKRRVTIPIMLNSSHYVMGSNRYEMNINFDATNNDARIAIKSCTLYNSSYNIKHSYNNNQFTLTWINGDSETFTIPDGYYDFSTLNDFLQYCMTSKGWFLKAKESNTTPVKSIFFMSFQPNSVVYSAEISVFFVEEKEGYEPAGSWTTNLKAPQIRLCPGLMKIFGFSSQSVFPSSQNNGVNETFTSETAPVLSPVFAYTLGCNWILNKYNVSNPQVFHQIALSEGFGQLIKDIPPSLNFMSVYQSNYSKIIITLWDQLFQPVVPVDAELALTLVVDYIEN